MLKKHRLRKNFREKVQSEVVFFNKMTGFVYTYYVTFDNVMTPIKNS